ncbi:putative carboxypeptidase D [Helianthus anomalus]
MLQHELVMCTFCFNKIGNAVIDEVYQKGKYDYWWSHIVISDSTHDAIFKYCDFASNSSSAMCDDILIDKAWNEKGDVDVYNIYAPICLTPRERNTSAIPGSVNNFDPCWQYILEFYFNDSMVQKALHAKPTSWDLCSDVITSWNDRAVTILPIIKYLIANGQRLWVFRQALSTLEMIIDMSGCCGDVDAQVPITSSRYAINALNLPIETAWRPWYLNKEVSIELTSLRD